MTTNEFKQLEHLLGELGVHIGKHPITITTGVIQDGYAIGVFDSKGNLEDQSASYDIESAAKKLRDKFHPDAITEHQIVD